MNDGQRVYPVEYFFLHHSTGPDFKNAEDLEVQDWYSSIGKSRAYGGGSINSMHEHPSRPGQLTYAQAQFTLREYDKDGNKYGWRLTDLIKDPWANVAWAVGDWFYNQRGSSVEICGNYIGRDLPDKACMLLADFLREIDDELGGILKVWLHNEVYATQCPAGIANQRDKIVDMINNPAKWNAILWPPAPVIESKMITTHEQIPFTNTNENDDSLPAGTNIVIVAGIDGVKTINTEITLTNGVETSRRVVSETVIQPVNQVTRIGTHVATDPDEPPIDNGGEPEVPVDQTTKDARIEAGKLVARNGLIAAISGLLGAAVDWLLQLVAGVKLPDQVVVGIIGVIYAGFLWLDKLLHVKAKLVESKVKGLIGF